MLALSPHTPSSRKAPCLTKTSGFTITVSSKPSFISLAKAATVGPRPHVSYSLTVTGISPIRASSVHHTTTCLSSSELPPVAHGSWPGQKTLCGHKRKVSACSPIPPSRRRSHLHISASCLRSPDSSLVLPGSRALFQKTHPLCYLGLRPWHTDNHNALPATLTTHKTVSPNY